MKRCMRLIAWLFVLLIVPAGLMAAVFCTPAQYDATFLGALRDKCALLSRAGRKPRIIVAGGSGAAFGQDSALLESLVPGYEVVNFGMYAGLGTAVMLDLAWPELREGDVVIFSPEQSAQTLSMYFSANSMWQAADGAFYLLPRLRADDLSAMAGSLAAFAADKLTCMRTGKPLPEGVYSRAAFNERGDISVLRVCNVMPGGFDPDMPVCFDPALLDADFAEYLRSYASRCERKGVTFLFRFCPMNAAAVPAGEVASSEAFAAFLTAQTGVRVLGDPADSLMEADWFYDTNFHLNTAGATVNTIRMAKALCDFLGLPEPSAAMPDMPAAAEAVPQTGDSSDAACFLYEAVGNALRLTGLTAEGAQRETLTIPAQIGGKPVTSFAPGVFAGNARIRQLTVPGGIGRVEDGSFAGCVNLTRIVMLHDDPADCPVGGGLLDGTAAMVYVPQEHLSSWMTNYFWAPHAQRLRGAGETAPAPVPQPITAPEASFVIRYDGNGGQTRSGESVIALPADDVHLRVNTAQGTRYFTREGYILTGWNTEADGSGTAVGLGSRIARGEGMTLYAQWSACSPEADFAYEIVRNEAYITAWLGDSADVVVPRSLGGAKVTRIRSGAFAGAAIDRVVLPETMFCVERGAFTGSTLQEITLSDNLYYIYDASFEGCERLATLRIHAATYPVYSGTYFDTFSDKYDWLLSIRDRRKIVLFSGSSGRYGYDSPAIRAAFPEYEVANMGVYAYTNALPQYDLLCDLMNAGDILLSAPEFDTTDDQFCETDRLDPHFFAMMESNYDALALLDLRGYTAVFDSLGKYLTTRSVMGSRSYAVSANGFDDDGNQYPFDTYNREGDFILPREGGTEDVLLQSFRADYTVEAFPVALIDRLNAAYQPFLDKGVKVYFSYTPRNWSSLTAESVPEARAALHAHLMEHLCVPVISGIEDYLYPATEFYLIDSHLSTRGVQLRTAQIIRDLQERLDCEALSE
ncbi:MAG: hypothetical protein E7327_03960 [Clostridiales bacterium]|nr:hypothetical protein [Clostridiales bacterium]